MVAIEEQKLFESIDILPTDLKTKLVDKLLSSINPTHASIDDLWIQEAQNRKEEIENGSVQLINGAEVFTKIKQRLEQ